MCLDKETDVDGWVKSFVPPMLRDKAKTDFGGRSRNLPCDF
jgi:hypothetical protein